MTDSAVEFTLRARPKSIDGFDVARVLPQAVRRSVGPFVFFDHLGPSAIEKGHGLDVRPHPHIHLSTVTYLFEGSFLHRDSLGSTQVIEPLAINWMTAGNGIVHSERTPNRDRESGGRIHGLQLWVAMPESHEDGAPSFAHHAATEIPVVDDARVSVRVLVGEAFGATSPVRALLPTTYLDMTIAAGGDIAIPTEHEERALYLLEGDALCDDIAIEPRTMLILRTGAPAVISSQRGARVVLIGGARLERPRYIWWNFVSSRKEAIEEAAARWKAGAFPRVPGDDVEFIPLHDTPRL